MTTRRPRLQVRPNVNKISRDVSSAQERKNSTALRSESKAEKTQPSENAVAEKELPVVIKVEEEEEESNDDVIPTSFKVAESGEKMSQQTVKVKNGRMGSRGKGSRVDKKGTPGSKKDRSGWHVNEDIKPVLTEDGRSISVENSVTADINGTEFSCDGLQSSATSSDHSVPADLQQTDSVQHENASVLDCAERPENVISSSPALEVPTPASVQTSGCHVTQPASESPVVESVSSPKSADHSVSETVSAPEVPKSASPHCSAVQTVSTAQSVSSSATPRLSALLSAPPVAANISKTVKKVKVDREARSRHWYNKAKEPPERSKMTMIDLVYWNPSENPMKSTKKEKSNEQTPVASAEKTEKPSNAAVQNREDAVDSSAPPAPKLKIGPNGEITLDEESLVIHHTVPDNYTVITEESSTNYSSFRNRQTSRRWSCKETAIFYKALMMVGTDFALMANLISDRSRHELKMKFKKEEKLNRDFIDKILRSPNAFDVEQFEHDVEEIQKSSLSDEPLKKKQKGRGRKPGVPTRPRTREDSLQCEVVERNRAQREGHRKTASIDSCDAEPSEGQFSDDDPKTAGGGEASVDVSESELPSHVEVTEGHEAAEGAAVSHASDGTEPQKKRRGRKKKTVQTDGEKSTNAGKEDTVVVKKRRGRKPKSKSTEKISENGHNIEGQKEANLDSPGLGNENGTGSSKVGTVKKRGRKPKSVSATGGAGPEATVESGSTAAVSVEAELGSGSGCATSLATGRPKRTIRRPKIYDSDDDDDDDETAVLSPGRKTRSDTSSSNEEGKKPRGRRPKPKPPVNSGSESQPRDVSMKVEAAGESDGSAVQKAVHPAKVLRENKETEIETSDKENALQTSAECREVIFTSVESNALELDEVGSFVTVEFQASKNRRQKNVPFAAAAAAAAATSDQKKRFNQAVVISDETVQSDVDHSFPSASKDNSGSGAEHEDKQAAHDESTVHISKQEHAPWQPAVSACLTVHNDTVSEHNKGSDSYTLNNRSVLSQMPTESTTDVEGVQNSSLIMQQVLSSDVSDHNREGTFASATSTEKAERTENEKVTVESCKGDENLHTIPEGSKVHGNERTHQNPAMLKEVNNAFKSTGICSTALHENENGVNRESVSDITAETEQVGGSDHVLAGPAPAAYVEKQIHQNESIDVSLDCRTRHEEGSTMDIVNGMQEIAAGFNLSGNANESKEVHSTEDTEKQYPRETYSGNVAKREVKQVKVVPVAPQVSENEETHVSRPLDIKQKGDTSETDIHSAHVHEGKTAERGHTCEQQKGIDPVRTKAHAEQGTGTLMVTDVVSAGDGDKDVVKAPGAGSQRLSRRLKIKPKVPGMAAKQRGRPSVHEESKKNDENITDLTVTSLKQASSVGESKVTSETTCRTIPMDNLCQREEKTEILPSVLCPREVTAGSDVHSDVEDVPASLYTSVPILASLSSTRGTDCANSSRQLAEEADLTNSEVNDAPDQSCSSRLNSTDLFPRTAATNTTYGCDEGHSVMINVPKDDFTDTPSSSKRTFVDAAEANKENSLGMILQDQTKSDEKLQDSPESWQEVAVSHLTTQGAQLEHDASNGQSSTKGLTPVKRKLKPTPHVASAIKKQNQKRGLCVANDEHQSSASRQMAAKNDVANTKHEQGNHVLASQTENSSSVFFDDSGKKSVTDDAPAQGAATYHHDLGNVGRADVSNAGTEAVPENESSRSLSVNCFHSSEQTGTAVGDTRKLSKEPAEHSSPLYQEHESENSQPTKKLRTDVVAPSLDCLDGQRSLCFSAVTEMQSTQRSPDGDLSGMEVSAVTQPAVDNITTKHPDAFITDVFSSGVQSRDMSDSHESSLVRNASEPGSRENEEHNLDVLGGKAEQTLSGPPPVSSGSAPSSLKEGGLAEEARHLRKRRQKTSPVLTNAIKRQRMQHHNDISNSNTTVAPVHPVQDSHNVELSQDIQDPVRSRYPMDGQPSCEVLSTPLAVDSPNSTVGTSQVLDADASHGNASSSLVSTHSVIPTETGNEATVDTVVHSDSVSSGMSKSRNSGDQKLDLQSAELTALGSAESVSEKMSSQEQENISRQSEVNEKSENVVSSLGPLVSSPTNKITDLIKEQQKVDQANESNSTLKVYSSTGHVEQKSLVSLGTDDDDDDDELDLGKFKKWKPIPRSNTPKKQDDLHL